MMKCRYSIDGNCTNDKVACEKCNSTDYEMRACTPFQRCIALHNDNWTIEIEDKKEEKNSERKRNNSSWCCDKIEELIEDYKISIEETDNEDVRRQLRITVDDLENILYS